jgi:hypothetical protein
VPPEDVLDTCAGCDVCRFELRNDLPSTNDDERLAAVLDCVEQVGEAPGCFRCGDLWHEIRLSEIPCWATRPLSDLQLDPTAPGCLARTNRLEIRDDWHPGHSTPLLLAGACPEMAPKIFENDKSPWSGCCRKLVTRGFVVGVRGFEPPASTSRTTPSRDISSHFVPVRALLTGLLWRHSPASPTSYQRVPRSLAPKMAPKIFRFEEWFESAEVTAPRV